MVNERFCVASESARPAVTEKPFSGREKRMQKTGETEYFPVRHFRPRPARADASAENGKYPLLIKTEQKNRSRTQPTEKKKQGETA